GAQARDIHRPAAYCPAACARPDLVVLCRPEGLPARSDTAPARSELRTRFDRIFRRRTGFVTLDRLLQRLHANKAELLMVLDRPEIPLHTNGSENDIRCQVTKRHVSGGTHSDIGRDCRDAFLGLAKTCRKLGIAFWDYLGARLGVSGGPSAPPLPDLIRCRGQPAGGHWQPGVMPRLHNASVRACNI